ncbi:DUF3108 domain-containing protein [Massilia forsythiae]|uniref:DUF3108 domain-containing protein n=2 Tax=Massilia forsythiae TaxID=2728020 RepID=A0A7Z2W126_9BURK|nr:DUF3108 domain-containing protein [Massilia forsythiae]
MLANPIHAAHAASPANGADAPAAEESHPAIKRAFELPPSADLAYSISARQRGFNLNGDATLTWRAGDNKYAINAESRVALVGKLTENRSQGTVDIYGLAPAEFYEKRFRKEPVTATFDRDKKSIGFTDGKQTYQIKGGEQDRVSVSWQLAAVARAAKDKFKPGSEWQFFVVGPHDADPWTFRVVGREKIQAGAAIGEVEAVHVVRAVPPGSKDQTLDLWLAPSKEWYPVKLRFTDNDRDYVEQTLERITRK